MDHAMNLAASSKPSDQQLRKPRCQMCCDKTVEHSVCDGWPNTNVSSRKLRRLACNSRKGTLELGTEVTDEQLLPKQERNMHFHTSNCHYELINFSSSAVGGQAIYMSIHCWTTTKLKMVDCRCTESILGA